MSAPLPLDQFDLDFLEYILLKFPELRNASNASRLYAAVRYIVGTLKEQGYSAWEQVVEWEREMLLPEFRLSYFYWKFVNEY